ncbi:vacuolar protein sorting protein (Vps36), putative [Rhizoctonia solani AG-3 Rhs1AP]|uniref:Vacuolar protein-sorting-associated protein 36 n=1 Tax=Rhizoctonia solani AG-3 Rhs1AP TaxID=1086054 RepID=X8IYM0_9AGAM|nr:vacuolar protein sorting protein (Vps36), putative [Rhizoctonia solani AG-3 Rhs1AP]
MNRHFRRVDGTIPVAALLYEDEQLVASQDSVGLYDGKEKTPNHQNGTIHVTSHRLIYIDNIYPRKFSTSCNLSRIKQTDVYAGFLKSSPKVILYLSAHEDKNNSNPEVVVTSTNGEDEELELEGRGKGGWVCPICSYNNPPSASDSSAPVCVLCGVPKNDDIPMPQQFRSVRSTKATRPALDIPASSSLPSGSAVSAPTSPVAPNGEIACPACTFFNHPSMTHCEICSTPLGNVVLRSPKPTMGTRSSPVTPARSPTATPITTPSKTPTTPDPNARDMIKVSFRRGGDKVWYTALKRTLLAKAWARAPANKVTPQARGIHGILQSVEINAQTTHDDMEDALKDLEALMSKAKEMADYAKLLNQKLTQQEEADRQRRDESGLPSNNDSAPSDSETTFIRSSLARLGLPTDAVTQDMVADEKAYHQELAKELGGLLLGGYAGKGGKARESDKRGSGILKDSRGIVGLDEVWGAWNRARGVALLPPSTLLSVVPLLPTYTTPPIHMRTLRSGLRVLHSPDYTREAFARRVDSFLIESFPVGKTTFQIAVAENEGAPGSQSRAAGLQSAGIVVRNEGAGVSLAMVQEMIECAEEDGAVVRDLGLGEAGELRWLPNLFVGYVWDGD